MTIFRKDEFELCEVPVPEGYPQSQTHCGVICVDGSYILSTSPYPVPKRSKWLVYIMAVLKKISFGIYNPFMSERILRIHVYTWVSRKKTEATPQYSGYLMVAL